MAKLFLLLGGNLGNKQQTFADAAHRIEIKVGNIQQRSSLFETEPWGFESENLFWNQVLVVDTKLSPQSALEATQQIENELGRVRHASQYSSRLIDIDLLFFDQTVLDTPQLQLPHPRIAERRFVLEPLAEIAPDFIHPVHRKLISQLLKECPDKLKVKKL